MPVYNQRFIDWITKGHPMADKIRPPTHSSNQSRKEVEQELPDQAAAPDLEGRGPAPEGAINASHAGAIAAIHGDAFSAAEAASLRAQHNDPNRLGKPYQLTSAEILILDYQQKLAAFKADYQGTRSTRLEVPYLEAKQKMIDAGLMKGDV